MAVGALSLLVVASFGVRLWLAWRVPTPWIMVDELIYSEMAKSFANTGHFLIRGAPAGIPSIGYPALISPAWLFGPVATSYGIAKAINAALISLTAVPTYFLALRNVRRRGLALLAAALVLVMPTLLYSGMLMTENAFLPTFVLAAWAIAVALERPTVFTQLAALAAIGLVCVFRVQGIVLILVLPTALVLMLALDVRADPAMRSPRAILRELVRFLPAAVVLGVALVGYVAYKVSQGLPLSSGLGDYSAVATTNYSFRDGARWALYHFAELPLAFGVVPASAFLVLLAMAVWRGAPSRRERAFLAVTTSSLVWVVLQVALFASRFSYRVEERYMLVLGPLFIVALVLWLDRGLPRPIVPALVAAAVPACLFATLPLASLLNVSIFSDTFGLIPFFRQAESHGQDVARELLIGGAAAAGLLFLVVPRRLGLVVVPLAIAAFLTLSTHSVAGAIRGYAYGLSQASGGGDHSWIDHRVGRGADVGYVYGTSADLFAEASILWQNEFWNRSIREVYSLGSPEPTGFAETVLKLNSRSGLLAGAPGARPAAKYVVTANGFDVDGTVLARHPPFVLYRRNGPLRIASSIQGVYADGWTGSGADYLRYSTPGERRGEIRVSLSRAAWGGPDVPGHVRVVVRTLTGHPRVASTRSIVIHRLQTRTLTLPTPKPPFGVDVTVSPTFSPATYGSADTRQLGVQASFVFRPRRR